MAAKRRRIAIGNWKMYGRLTSGLQLARDLLEKAEEKKPLPFDVVICPPATLIWPISEVIMGSPIGLGAQDSHTATHGAFTGDLSAAMFADLGCRYVILGHSERRHGHGETDELVAEKVAAAQLAGLTTIVCVGETAEQLASGLTEETINLQIKTSLPEKCNLANVIVAYEPVWAIGTGQQPAPDDIAKVHKIIRKAFGSVGETIRIVYGGSVAPANAESILKLPEVDGVLVGGASLVADSFWEIAEHCV
jgi:triosephosphate isomerase